MPGFKLVVFDLDGTLIDSQRDIANAANALLVEHGARPLPDDRIARMVGEGASVLVTRAFEAAGCPAPADALRRFVEIYDAHLVEHTRPYDGVVDVLQTLSSRSTLALLTNKPLGSTRAILEALDLGGFFAGRVLGGDGPLPRKPDPAGLTWLMAAVDARSESTVMVGDSMIDWRTASAAGTRVCLAAYGFGFESFPREQLRDDDRVAWTPIDLLRWL